MVKVETWDKATQSVVVRELTRDQFLAEFPDSTLFDKPKPESEMTEGERYLADKMQSEQDVNEQLAKSGVTSVLDMRQDDDDETIPLDDLVPREYDDAGAYADHVARHG